VISLRCPGTAEQDHGLGMGRVGETVKEGHGMQPEAGIQERLEISCQAGVITGHPDECRRCSSVGEYAAQTPGGGQADTVSGRIADQDVGEFTIANPGLDEFSNVAHYGVGRQSRVIELQCGDG